MAYSEIIWQQDWTKLQGFMIKSPFSGQLMPISSHPYLLYRQDILPNTLSCKLEQGTFYAPFNAEFATSRDVDRRLTFKHLSGLTLTLDLPIELRDLHGKGMHWLCRANQHVTAGTPVLQLDLPFLQIQLPEVHCLATISAPKPLGKIYSRKARVNANEDALFVLQLQQHDKN